MIKMQNSWIWSSPLLKWQTLLCTTVLWGPQWQETQTHCTKTWLEGVKKQNTKEGLMFRGRPLHKLSGDTLSLYYKVSYCLFFWKQHIFWVCYSSKIQCLFQNMLLYFIFLLTRLSGRRLTELWLYTVCWLEWNVGWSSLIMYCIFTCKYFVFIGIISQDLTPVKNEVKILESDTVTLSYSYSKTAAAGDEFYWYRRDHVKPPRFLVSVLGFESSNTTSNLNNRISANLNRENRLNLIIFSTEVTDSALYYCAVRPTVTGNTDTLHKNYRNWSTYQSSYHSCTLHHHSPCVVTIKPF